MSSHASPLGLEEAQHSPATTRCGLKSALLPFGLLFDVPCARLQSISSPLPLRSKSFGLRISLLPLRHRRAEPIRPTAATAESTSAATTPTAIPTLLRALTTTSAEPTLARRTPTLSTCGR